MHLEASAAPGSYLSCRRSTTHRWSEQWHRAEPGIFRSTGESTPCSHSPIRNEQERAVEPVSASHCRRGSSASVTTDCCRRRPRWRGYNWRAPCWRCPRRTRVRPRTQPSSCGAWPRSTSSAARTVAPRAGTACKLCRPIAPRWPRSPPRVGGRREAQRLGHCAQELVAPQRAMRARVRLRPTRTHYRLTGRACSVAASLEPAPPPPPMPSCASAQVTFGSCATPPGLTDCIHMATVAAC